MSVQVYNADTNDLHFEYPPDINPWTEDCVGYFTVFYGWVESNGEPTIASCDYSLLNYYYKIKKEN